MSHRSDFREPGMTKGQAWQHFRNDGQPKQAFATVTEAVTKHLSHRGQPDYVPMHPYRCAWCGAIHLGRVRRKRNRVRHDESLGIELGGRVVGHLAKENLGDSRRRMAQIKHHGRKAGHS